jgi:hypothetical protein
VAAGLLPPAIQQFVADSAGWVAGIDEMIAANDRLLQSITAVDEASATAGMSAAGAGEGAAAGAGAEAAAAGDAASAEASRAAAAAAGELGGAQDQAAATAKALADAEEAYAAAASRASEAAYNLAAASREDTSAGSAYDAALKANTDATLGLLDAQARLAEAELAASGAAEKAAAAQAAAGDASVASGAKSAEAGGAVAAAGGKMKMALIGVAVGAGVAVDAASKFQDATTHLVTDAGESAANLSMVQQGILRVSAATGTSANDITNAMYHIESAGMHGASGLSVLSVAAEGAKVGGADLDTVSKTLVGTLNAYGMTSTNAGKQTQYATQMMNQLISTVGSGDMRMQDLASSLSSVAPLAAAVHIQFAEVGGAIATMTAQGMSAQQATQDLSNTIRSLSNPNNVAINEMQQMGLSAQQVSSQLGQRGLTGTLSILTQAILAHMGPSGQVLQSAFNNAKNAAADAQVEIKAMPASLQKLATGFLSGSVTAKQWKADLQGLDPVQSHLMTQFATTAEKAHSFNTLLAAGSPAAQTYTAALAKIMGGATGLNTALMLTGGRMSTFIANTAAVYNAGVTTGKSVSNWATIQGTFNFKLEQSKTALEDTGIALGSALLPAVSAVLGPLAQFLAMIAGNKTESIALAVVVGGILAGALGLKLANSLKGASEGIKAVGEGAEWLIGKLTAQTVVTEAETAATEAATVAQEEFDAAAAANPIGLIIVAIAAVIAVIVELTLHSRAFRVFWKDVWRDVAGAAVAAGHVIEAAFNAVAGFFEVLYHDIESGIDTVVKFISSHWRTIVPILMLILGPIGIIAAGIFELVTHFQQVEHGVEDAVNAVVNFVGSHWKLLIALILGPIGLIIDALATHWSAVEHGFESAFNFCAAITRAGVKAISAVLSPWIALLETIFRVGWAIVTAIFSAAWDACSVVVRAGIAAARDVLTPFISWLEDLFRVGWAAVTAVVRAAVAVITAVVQAGVAAVRTVLSWFEQLAGLFRGWWDAAYNAVLAPIGHLIATVAAIPGQILAALAGLAGDLFNAGLHAMESLASGLASGAGSVVGTVAGLASKVAGFFGLSPAREGSLAGGGAPEIRGAHFAAALAAGMLGGRGSIAAAAAALAQAAGVSSAYAGTGGSGVVTAPGGAGLSSSAAQQMQMGLSLNIQMPSPAQWQEFTQKYTLQYNRRNMTNGLALTAR